MVNSTASEQNPALVSLGVSIDSTECVVNVPKTLTVVEAIEFEQAVMQRCLIKPELQKLAINLSQTTFIDSSGLGALVICYRASQAQGVPMVLQGVQEQVRMALAMTDLEQLFTFEPVTATAAQANLGQERVDITSEPQRLEPISTHPSVTSRGKRLTDIVGAIVGLAITGLLSIPIVAAIKLEDGGPIFFSQVRCSWMGKRFRIWKFRSMVTNAEALKAKVANEVEGPLFKNENDPRITRIGRFIRRTSLDELPQFWNVLKGDMSLVGTRPPTPDELDQYKVPEWQRLDVKPGMTGEWQVNGRSSVKKFEDVIQMDLNYQKNWSLWYDYKLIIKTVLVLFSKKAGAS